MNTRARKSYYVHSEGQGREHIIRGIKWLQDLAETENKKSVLLAVPDPKNLDHAIEDILTERAVKLLKKGSAIQINSAFSLALLTDRRDVPTHAGPILAVYPSKKLLDKIDDMREVTDVLVIPWSLPEVKLWIETWNAQDLSEKETAPSSRNSLDPIVEAALQSLTSEVNIGTGISHPSVVTPKSWTRKCLCLF